MEFCSGVMGFYRTRYFIPASVWSRSGPKHAVVLHLSPRSPHVESSSCFDACAFRVCFCACLFAEVWCYNVPWHATDPCMDPWIHEDLHGTIDQQSGQQALAPALQKTVPVQLIQRLCGRRPSGMFSQKQQQIANVWETCFNHACLMGSLS